MRPSQITIYAQLCPLQRPLTALIASPRPPPTAHSPRRTMTMIRGLLLIAQAYAISAKSSPIQPSAKWTAFASPHLKRTRIRTTSSSSSSTAIFANKDERPSSSFLSTQKATVQFTSSSSSSVANLSPIDSLLLTLTSDRFSLLLGSLGILLLLLNRLFTFPSDVMYEASRSRIDLLGVFAAGSVLLNGITKLDVTSVTADRVALEGVVYDEIVWLDNCSNNSDESLSEVFVETAQWALTSFIKCSPARTAILLRNEGGDDTSWIPVAITGVLPFTITNQEEEVASLLLPKDRSTPILDRMKRYDASSTNTKGGSVAIGSLSKRRRNMNNNAPKESYLPTLQALPGKVEFTYLPSNTQEVLILPVPTVTAANGGMTYAVVLGGDVAKSFSPKDVAWCREIAAWIGDSLEQ
eukprot:scaffold90134_cov51-Cyclotella_meneghiniana.AAC.4